MDKKREKEREKKKEKNEFSLSKNSVTN